METIGIIQKRFRLNVQWGTIILLVILVTVLVSAAMGLGEVVHNLDYGRLLLPIILVGLPSSWLVFSRRESGWRAALGLLFLGLITILIRISNSGDEIWNMAEGASAFLWGDQRFSGGISGSAQLLEAARNLLLALSVVLARSLEWIQDLIRGQPGFDPVASAIVWGLLFWVTSIWAGGIASRRGDSILAILPAGIILSAGLAYSWHVSEWLLVLLAGVLLLLSPLRYRLDRDRWDAEKIDYPYDVGKELAAIASFAAIALVILAAVTPSISYKQLVELFEGMGGSGSTSSRELAESVGLQGRVERPVDAFAEVRSPGLPRQHLIGSGPELSEELVMYVHVEGIALPRTGYGLSHYYWRALNYDVYTGRGWRTSSTKEVGFSPGDTIPQLAGTRQLPVRQEVQKAEGTGDLLYAAGDLVTSDEEFKVAWRTQSDFFGATVNGQNYRADSSLPWANEETLRASGSGYTDWLRERYLALPDTIPSRVFSLARDLTAAEPTPYDRALAIENYLRSFPYNLDVPAPPGGRDVVDFFIFDLQEGYCDYYATSMVVLARAAGLPARLAVGYVRGEYDEERDVFRVSMAESHSWAEVYFPEVGWVAFEPTAGRPPLDRESIEPSEIAQELEELEAQAFTDIRFNWLLAIAGTFLLLGLALASLILVDMYRLHRLTPSAAVIHIYNRMRDYGDHLPILTHPGDTPYEYASTLSGFLGLFAQRLGWMRSADKDVNRLAQLVVLEQFSEYTGGELGKRQAISLWLHLRWKLLITRIWSAFRR